MRMLWLIAAGLGVALATQSPSVDVTTLGPQVGERVAPFSLADQRGTTRDLRSVAGPKGTVLVFFRSADW